MIVTIFEHLLNTKSPKYANVNIVLQGIRDGGKLSPLISQIRNSKTVEERGELKKKLPVVCFSGKFSERKASALIEYSGLICLDFDKLECPEDFKSELVDNPYIFAAWISPTATGVKALVKVSSSNHLGHSAALVREFPELDINAVKDVPRCCFMSEDKDIYINDKSQIFTKFVENARTDEDKFELLKKWLSNKGSHFKEGERNTFLAKLFGAMNRFGFPKEIAWKLVNDAYLNGSNFSTQEAQSVLASMYRYEEQFGTASFDDSFSTSEVGEILSGEVKTSDIIYLNNVREDLIRDYVEGVHKGPTTYFPRLDEVFRRVPGQLNVLTGIGNHGKSTFQQQLDLIDSVMTGGKFGYFGPEAYPPKRWYRQLIQAIIGKTTNPDSGNRMSRAEFDLAMDFINDRFIYIYPPELPTPEYITERFVEAIIKHGLKGVTIDPFNQLLHSMSKRDDIYLAETLSRFERFGQMYQILLTIITHPNKTTKDDKGNYNAPDVYDLNGGPVWNARASNIYTYHRPVYSSTPSDPGCELIFRKIKDQELCGIPGTVNFQYDRRNFRFYDNGYSPLTNFKL